MVLTDVSADVTKLPEYRRASLLGRVFQDPMMGTAANMGIEENLALAYRRGERRGLKWGITHNMRDAIKYGNRLIMMYEGKIILDISGDDKKNITIEYLLEQFEKASGSELASDRMLLT